MSGILEMKFLFIFISIFGVAFGVVQKSAKLESLNNCGGEYSGYQYTIVSPNYPDNYSDNEDCIYILRGSSQAKCNQIFNLRFLNFTLRHSHECQTDYLEIGDRSIFCGNVVGIRNYSSKNNTLKLRFHSDSSGSDKGFKIQVTTLPCPNIVEATSGIVEKDCDKGNENNQENLGTQLSTSIVNRDSENINTKNLYPVYRATDDKFTNEHISPSESIHSPKLNINQGVNNNSSVHDSNEPQVHRHFQLPHYNTNLFRSTASPVKISTYFFASPDDDDDASIPFLKTSGSNTENIKNNVETIVTTPSSKLLLPIHEHTIFNDSPDKLVNQSQSIDNDSFKFERIGGSIGRNNDKLIFPLRPNNIRPGTPYAPLPGFEPQIITGEVSDHVGEPIDCNGKTNIDSTLRIPGNTRDVFLPGNNYVPSVLASRPNIFPASIYGAPGARHPPTIESIPNIPTNPNIIIDSEVINPINVQPDEFIPTQNVGNIFPGIIPNYNPSLRQCCYNNYITQQFLLTSPGFPSLFYSANSYECIYTIIPSSLNICRIRFNLKYFNHGNNDEYCINGYIEIDGRRYCGCKTGLTIVTNVINSTPKIIGVNYSGYPRSKFNGFLIEVTQEPCSYNNYPNLLRSKKAVNDTILDDLKSNEFSSSNRTRRHLGYTYSKPNIPFDPIGVQSNSNAGGSTALSRCQALTLLDWTLAAKEAHFRGARCYTNNGNSGSIPGIPSFTPDNLFPGQNNGYPSFPSGGNRPDIIFPGPSIPQPPNTRGSSNGLPPLGNCQLVSTAEGIISSPGYPNPYPSNVNLCYRFLRTPNGCRLHMTILDFDLENTPGCVKDYLLFSNQNSRYCGRSLAGTKTILVFPRNNVIDVRFVSDSYGTGRGFNIGFVQVACEDI